MIQILCPRAHPHFPLASPAIASLAHHPHHTTPHHTTSHCFSYFLNAFNIFSKGLKFLRDECVCQKWSTWYRKIKTSDLLAEIPICFRAPFCENLLLLTTGSFWLWLVLAVASGSHSKSFVKRYHSAHYSNHFTDITLLHEEKNSAGFLQQSWRGSE